MSTAVAEKWIYRLRKSSIGGFQKGDFVTPVNGTPDTLKDFEQNHPCLPERYTGQIDHPEDVAEIDISPVQDWTNPVVVDLFADDIKARFGFVGNDQIEVCVNELGMPKGGRQFITNGLIGQVTAVRRVWRSDAIDKYESILHRVFPALAKR